MKHTPGPWKIHTDSQLHGEYTLYAGNSKDDADAVVCEIAGGLGVYDEGCCESEANATLIAAAPDLLAACKALLSELDTPVKDHVMIRNAKDQMRAAIVKAEGEI